MELDECQTRFLQKRVGPSTSTFQSNDDLDFGNNDVEEEYYKFIEQKQISLTVGQSPARSSFKPALKQVSFKAAATNASSVSIEHSNSNVIFEKTHIRTTFEK